MIINSAYFGITNTTTHTHIPLIWFASCTTQRSLLSFRTCVSVLPLNLNKTVLPSFHLSPISMATPREGKRFPSGFRSLCLFVSNFQSRLCVCAQIKRFFVLRNLRQITPSLLSIVFHLYVEELCIHTHVYEQSSRLAHTLKNSRWHSCSKHAFNSAAFLPSSSPPFSMQL